MGYPTDLEFFLNAIHPDRDGRSGYFSPTFTNRKLPSKELKYAEEKFNLFGFLLYRPGDERFKDFLAHDFKILDEITGQSFLFFTLLNSLKDERHIRGAMWERLYLEEGRIQVLPSDRFLTESSFINASFPVDDSSLPAIVLFPSFLSKDYLIIRPIKDRGGFEQFTAAMKLLGDLATVSRGNKDVEWFFYKLKEKEISVRYCRLEKTMVDYLACVLLSIPQYKSAFREWGSGKQVSWLKQAIRKEIKFYEALLDSDSLVEDTNQKTQAKQEFVFEPSEHYLGLDDPFAFSSMAPKHNSFLTDSEAKAEKQRRYAFILSNLKMALSRLVRRQTPDLNLDLNIVPIRFSNFHRIRSKTLKNYEAQIQIQTSLAQKQEGMDFAPIVNYIFRYITFLTEYFEIQEMRVSNGIGSEYRDLFYPDLEPDKFLKKHYFCEDNEEKRQFQFYNQPRESEPDLFRKPNVYNNLQCCKLEWEVNPSFRRSLAHLHGRIEAIDKTRYLRNGIEHHHKFLFNLDELNEIIEGFNGVLESYERDLSNRV